MDFTRLFEIPSYQLREYPQKVALAGKENGQWVKYSTQDLIDETYKVARAMLAFGIKPDEKVALISGNRPEWNFTDIGMLRVGAVNVPIYPTISESEYKFIFNDAEIKLCFVQNEDLYNKIQSIRSEIPSLQEVYTFDKIPGAKHYSEFLALADSEDNGPVDEISKGIDPETLATIIYTSGTTGQPKGVMLSHRNLVSNLKGVQSSLPLKSEHTTLSFLPLCHIFERIVTYTYFAKGASCYYAESLETIGDNLKEIKPHFFTSVPRLLEKVYEKIVSAGHDLTGLKKKLFFWAVELGKQYDFQDKGSAWYRMQLNIARKLIFSKWQEALGGNVIMIVTGAAALQPRMGRIFSAAGIAIREGYGQTETSPVLTINGFDENDAMIGTVGKVIPGVQIKIGENEEILAKGPNVMMGYYKRPDITAETIDKDGWLHTGDQGKFINGEFLKITGRVKELFKTSGGKYVAPAVIENKMKESRFIEQIMVIGEYRKFVSALIVPSFANLEEWCKSNGVTFSSHEDLVKNPKVQDLFRKEIDEHNVNFGKWEQIKKFTLVPFEWSVDGGELTPTMKVKRRVILKNHESDIEEIYDV